MFQSALFFFGHRESAKLRLRSIMADSQRDATVSRRRSALRRRRRGHKKCKPDRVPSLCHGERRVALATDSYWLRSRSRA